MYGRQPYSAHQRYAAPPPQPYGHPYQNGGRYDSHPSYPAHQVQHEAYYQHHHHQYPQHPHAASSSYGLPAPPSATQGFVLPHPMIAHDPQAFDQVFKDQLAALTVNSKPIINSLTMLAHDHAPKMNQVISSALEQHILTAPIPMRLTAMYLLDSISKNVGHPYTSNWSGIITRLFLETFRVVDAPTRKRLEELLATWRNGGPEGAPLFGESAQWTIERSLYGTQQNPHGLAHQLAARDSEAAVRSPIAHHGQHGHGGRPVEPALQGYRSPMAGHAYASAGPSQEHSLARVAQGTHSDHLPPTSASSQAPAGQAGNAANSLIASLLQAGLLSQETQQPRATPPVAEVEQDDGYVQLLMNLDISMNSGPSDWAKAVQTQLQMQGHNAFDPLELVLHQRGMPATCKQCANRYSASRQGHRALDEHLDWHFRQNRRAKESAMRGQSRSWFTNAEVWVRSGFDDTVPTSSGGEGGADGSRAGRSAEEEAKLRASYQATVVVAPTDTEVAARPCPICKEKFQSEWSEEEEDWIWRNAVLVDGVYYHASCHASAKVLSEKVTTTTTTTRGATPEVLSGRAKSPLAPTPTLAGSRATTPQVQAVALPADSNAAKTAAAAAAEGTGKTTADPVARLKLEDGIDSSALSTPAEAAAATGTATAAATATNLSRKRKESPVVAEAGESGEESVRVKKERV